jgi:hypothetical protein
MNAHRIRIAGKRGERGYALLVVLFLVTLLVLSTAAVAPNVLTEGKREKEKEMIWRGKQYTRGVKLYYRKMGRFPTSMDDLTKPKLGSLRFMRQQYKDPMNKEDGAWRLIYVGPGGQLIGSLKPPQQNLQLPGATGIGTPASALNGSNSPAQPGGLGQQSPGGLLPSASAANSGTNPVGATGTPVSADQGTPSSNGQGAGLGETPTIIGGNIIGVGSKIDKPSIIVYEKAKKYMLFEFIWDPAKDRQIAGQPGMQTGQPIGQQIGQPAGQQPGQNPGKPPQNPQPNPQ